MPWHDDVAGAVEVGGGDGADKGFVLALARLDGDGLVGLADDLLACHKGIVGPTLAADPKSLSSTSSNISGTDYETCEFQLEQRTHGII